MLLFEYRENANNTKGLKVFQRFLTVINVKTYQFKTGCKDDMVISDI